MTRPALLLALAVAGMTLSGCGLRPLYGGGVGGPVQTMLSGVEVAPIQGEAGWLVSNAVRDRIEATRSGTPAYRLEIKLDDRIEGLGVRSDDVVTRERRTLRARYQLIDLTTGQTVLDATAESDAGIDVAGSEYATIAAERSALERLSGIVADQIVARLARYARSSSPK
ncbi:MULTISPECIES: LPS assembly lipoprotein LptE [unclassified Sphingomonas]|uniref:LPS assembly lipoprotein LptE n=1 Tax=unclassified Sphingomonas TaxID=196159 RepID=UPI0021509D84|nr:MULTISPECIES: LPS assembly lipoprotein LptE [unclassified Sphingomonas]MCR5870413.1 LPS assembly lipoprotein LptE [Sphingomonas sp. J344]UUY01242.1 LPS assembly lipoprotein LptE [Sphingomonas sp. J315]